MVLNSHIHLTLETSQLEKLRKEAEEQEISISELIRRKLSDTPTDEEIVMLRKIKEILDRK